MLNEPSLLLLQETAAFVETALQHQVDLTEQLSESSKSCTETQSLSHLFSYRFLPKIISCVDSSPETDEHVTCGLFASRSSKMKWGLLFLGEKFNVDE